MIDDEIKRGRSLTIDGAFLHGHITYSAILWGAPSVDGCEDMIAKAHGFTIAEAVQNLELCISQNTTQ